MLAALEDKVDPIIFPEPIMKNSITPDSNSQEI